MKRVRTFDEKIYDPVAGTGASSTQVLKQFSNEEDLFISFTQIDKLGINPRSKYDTPLGIYTYPLKAIFENWIDPEDDLTQRIGEFVPFAGENPYVYVAQYRGSEDLIIRNIGDSAVYTFRDYERDAEKLKQIAVSHFLDLGFLPVNAKDRFNFILESAEDGAYNKSPGGLFWNLSRMVAWETAGQKRGSLQWNTILRNLGYTAIVDLDEGIIHKNETIQAAFLTKSALKIVDRIENVAAAGSFLRADKKAQLRGRMYSNSDLKDILDIRNKAAYLPLSKVPESWLEQNTQSLHYYLKSKLPSIPWDLYFQVMDDYISGTLAPQTLDYLWASAIKRLPDAREAFQAWYDRRSTMAKPPTIKSLNDVK